MRVIERMNSVKILHLSTTQFRGAGIASLYLYNCLQNAGYESYFSVFESKRTGYLFQKLALLRKKMIPDRLWMLIRRRNDQKYCLYSINDYNLQISGKKIMKVVPFIPDIILIHWVSGFVNARVIKELYDLTQAKIYWTMMDNAPITGGCHYPWDCEGYKYQCGSCPALGTNDSKDFTYLNLSQKIKNLSDINISIISFSQNDYLRAKASAIFSGKNIYKMYLPVDKTKFKMLDSTINLKIKLGIPIHKKILLYGASNIQDKRKGVDFFFQAWNKLNAKNIIVLLIGKADRECVEELGINTIYMGSVNEEKLIQCYQVSDMFVCTTLEDSGPYMINQSLMCGTPVVAYDIGVAKELVQVGKTGYNCGVPSVDSLVEGIQYIAELDDTKRREMRNNCRQIAVQLFSIHRFIQKFESIIS